MSRTYSAGVSTAYGAAVRGGYTGTYEQWCQEMAELGDNVAAVAQAKQEVTEAVEVFIDQTVPAAVGSVNSAGAAQVTLVQNTGSAAVGSVNSAGAAQITLVQNTGSAAVGSVNSAGAAQVASVEAKGQEVRESIPQDYSALTGEVDDIKSAIGDFAHLQTSPNLFNPGADDLLIGQYRNGSNNVVTDSRFLCTGMIDVRGITTLYIKQFDYSDGNVGFLQVLKYAADGSFIERSTVSANSYTVGDEAFARFNIQYPSGDASATLAESLMIAQYSPMSFVPFYEPYYSIDGVYIEPIDANNFDIHFGDACVTLFYTSNSSIGADNWNLKVIKLRGNIITPSGTDILGPVKINSDSDFIGGIHGDETTNAIDIAINGSSVTPAEIKAPIYGKTMTLVLVSTLYEEGTTTEAFRRIVQINFEPNKMSVDCTYTTREALTLVRATNGGLIAAQNPIIKSIALNSQYLSRAPSTAVNVSSVSNIEATMFTTYGSLTVKNLIGHTLASYLGYLQVFENENPKRCKIYFDTYKSGSYSLAVGAKIPGAFEYIFA